MSELRGRVGVYNKYWASRGGGERHSGMIAQVLSQAGAHVDLIGHTEVDLDGLDAYLGLDLTGCRLRVVPDIGDIGLTGMTADYDLLVNGSYMSHLPSQARHAIYLCYFPTPADHDLAGWQRRAIRVVGRLASHGEGYISLKLGNWLVPSGGRPQTTVDMEQR